MAPLKWMALYLCQSKLEPSYSFTLLPRIDPSETAPVTRVARSSSAIKMPSPIAETKTNIKSSDPAGSHKGAILLESIDSIYFDSIEQYREVLDNTQKPETQKDVVQ
jgi:hypothetical protein